MLDVDTPFAFNVSATPPTAAVTAGGSVVLLVPVPGTPGQDGAPGAGGADWTPEDFDLTAWSFSPLGISDRTAAMFNGLLNLVGIKIPTPTTVTNLHIFLATQGTNLTSGQSFAALYQNGDLLAVTADQSVPWETTVGHQTMALSSPQAVDPGMIYVGFWSVGDTPPTPGVLSANQQNLTKSTVRYAFEVTHAPLDTTAPTTLGTLVDGSAYWAAVS